jgi:hypothetical protein
VSYDATISPRWGVGRGQVLAVRREQKGYPWRRFEKHHREQWLKYIKHYRVAIARSTSTTGAFSPKFQGINIKVSDNWPTSKLVVPCEKQL